MAKIIAPNKEYSGESASVKFENGVGHTDDPNLITWFKEKGYEIEETETAKTAAKSSRSQTEKAPKKGKTSQVSADKTSEAEKTSTVAEVKTSETEETQTSQPQS